jgi:hypothetical protein
VAGAFDALDGGLKGGEGAEGGERPAAALYREAGEGLEVEGKPDVRAGLAARGEREGSAGGPARRNWAVRGPEVERAAAGRKEKEKLGPRGGKVGWVR